MDELTTPTTRAFLRKASPKGMSGGRFCSTNVVAEAILCVSHSSFNAAYPLVRACVDLGGVVSVRREDIFVDSVLRQAVTAAASLPMQGESFRQGKDRNRLLRSSRPNLKKMQLDFGKRPRLSSCQLAYSLPV